MSSMIPQNNNIIAYSGTPDDDLRIMQWYLRMLQDGEFNEFMADNVNTLGQFYAVINRPESTLLYECDNNGILQTALFEPFFKSVCASIWTIKSLRGTSRQIAFMHAILAAAYNVWPSIVALVRHDWIATMHAKAGFKIAGELPYLSGSDPTTILYATKEMYENSHFYKLGGNNENIQQRHN